jgi:hypothetical protein
MKRKWRIVIFVALAVALAAIPVLLHGMLDQAVTITHMSDGYFRTEKDFKTLAQAFPRDRYRKKDIVVILRRIDPQGFIVETRCSVQLNGLRFEFNARDELVGINTKAESAPDYECRA